MSEQFPGMGEKPAELLQRLLAQRGWNPHRLASMTDGEVSATTIRNYLKGSTPAIENLKWVALQFGLEDGSALLRAYGHEKTAEWFERDLQIAERSRKDLLRQAKLFKEDRPELTGHSLTYDGVPLTADQEREARQLLDFIRQRDQQR